MLKNKIYNYLSNEILKNFIIILLTFTAIAWVVRAVNFLDLIVEDGYTSTIYFKYSFLNITTLITRFVPLSFLLALTISIVKFEKQQELLILWTSGLTKIKIANIFLSIGFFMTLFQLILSLFINPYLLNKSRTLLKISDGLQVSSVLKSNDFSDTFKGLTFYVGEKNTNNELLNIFIKDVGGNLKTVAEEAEETKNTTIIAKKGYVDNNKLILFNGIIHSLNKKNKFKNIEFEKTELSLADISTRTITVPKIQETSSILLLKCILNKDNNLTLDNCSKKDEFKREAIQNISRRLGSPLYIPLISIIVSFLLIYKKERKLNFLKKYIVFILAFLVLISAEIFVRFSGFSYINSALYFFTPFVLTMLLYSVIAKKTNSTKVNK
jgi:lipopolysaccharide export system permease protein